MRPLSPFPHFPRLAAAVVVVVAALTACGSARPPAAVVDGETITDAQLKDEMVLFSFLGSLQQQPCGQAQTGESADAACARFTLSNLIQEDIVKHYAASHDITVADADVNGAVSQLESNLGGAEQLDKRLREAGVTRSQFLALARRLLLFSKTQGAIASQSVSDEQLRALYEQQKQQFTQIHAEHILVDSRSLAQRIADQATPKNFSTLAKKYSTDPGSADKGGDLGTLPASQLDPDFVAAALALRPGEISGPVHTQFGWHVIMLVSADVQPLDQVRDQLSGSLGGQAFTTWLGKRLGSAEIDVNPKYGRFDSSTGEVLPIRSTEATPSATPTTSATSAASAPASSSP
jgi:parvulin-like peptidyl-prolyl isomerase